MNRIRFVDTAGRLIGADALKAQREQLPEHLHDAFEKVIAAVKDSENAEFALKIAEQACAEAASAARSARDKALALRPSPYENWKSTFANGR